MLPNNVQIIGTCMNIVWEQSKSSTHKKDKTMGGERIYSKNLLIFFWKKPITFRILEFKTTLNWYKYLQNIY